jgi:hypothetical protein
MLRREARLREPAVPLRPHGLFAVGEVQSFDNGAPLPPIVRGIGRLVEDVTPGGHVPPPDTRLGRGVEVQRLDGAR